MEAIEEETLNGVPGIDDPDDDVPWAANVSFPDDESGHQEGQDTESDWPGRGQRQDPTPQRTVLVATPQRRTAEPLQV